MQGFWSKNLFLKYPLMGDKKRKLQAIGILLLFNYARDPLTHSKGDQKRIHHVRPSFIFVELPQDACYENCDCPEGMQGVQPFCYPIESGEGYKFMDEAFSAVNFLITI